jgi:chloramphenicol 3-O phosphotransferase
MVPSVIVLNGGSSSGKTSIARCLQKLLGPTWMTLGVDDLVRALPDGEKLAGRVESFPHTAGPVEGGGLVLEPDGSVGVTPAFRKAEAAWYAGLAAIGRCGTGLILDEVFLGGRSSQQRLDGALSDLAVMWVGVRCDAEVAAAREDARADRVGGMARLQAERVHDGVAYDLVVDTSASDAADCAAAIAAHLAALRG